MTFFSKTIDNVFELHVYELPKTVLRSIKSLQSTDFLNTICFLYKLKINQEIKIQIATGKTM